MKKIIGANMDINTLEAVEKRIDYYTKKLEIANSNIHKPIDTVITQKLLDFWVKFKIKHYSK
jgi:hypothetical protein